MVRDQVRVRASARVVRVKLGLDAVVARKLHTSARRGRLGRWAGCLSGAFQVPLARAITCRFFIAIATLPSDCTQVTVTACEKEKGQGTVCGFVYFPCNDENGCSAVTKGAF